MSEHQALNESEADRKVGGGSDAMDSAEAAEAAVDSSAPKPRRGLMISIVLVAVAVVAAVVLAVMFFMGRGSGVDLPEGFPSQRELPLASGERIAAADLEGSQASVTVEVESHEEQVAAIEKLRDSGFSIIGQSGSGPIGTVTSLVSDTVAVRVEFGQTEDGAFTVDYVTSPITDGASAQ